jgi:acyl carrier protein
MTTMSQLDTIQTKLYAILVGICGPTAQDLPPDADLMAGLGLDSLTTVRLTIELNRAFDIDFGVEAGDLDALRSVESLARVVHQRQQPPAIASAAQ